MLVKRFALRTAVEFILVVGMLIALMLLAAVLGGRKNGEDSAVIAEEDPVVVIDAGHGGMDGGAVGAGTETGIQQHMDREADTGIPGSDYPEDEERGGFQPGC